MQKTMTLSECAAWLGFPEEALRKTAEEHGFPISTGEDGAERVHAHALDRWMAEEIAQRMVDSVGG